MLRLASSTVVSNALRAVSSPRILSGSIANAFNGSDQDSLKKETPFISHHQLFSTDAKNPFDHQQFFTDAKKQIDDKLIKILKTEIKLNRLSMGETIGTPPTPPHFPFMIEYSPCAKVAILRRRLNREMIIAYVSLPDHDEEEDDSDNSNDNSSSDGISSEPDNSEKSTDAKEESACGGPSVPHVRVVVNIFKDDGKIFELRLSAASSEITVSRILLKEPAGREFMEFGPLPVSKDSDLGPALVEYLEFRGFDKCIGGFLYKYMICNSPVTLLKRLKKFVRD